MRTGKDYAVKVVKLVRPEDAGLVELMKAEYAIGSSIDHPVIRKVYEFRPIRQRFRMRGAILFLEYVAGVSLADNEFNASLDEVLRIFRDVALGLQAMHSAGYVHADLKPNNILVTGRGSAGDPERAVKLIDLGQSAGIHQPKAKIQGTIDYMAPEQVQRGKLDQRTDVFGLGAALHKVVTGKPIPTEMNQTVSVHSQSLVGRRITEIRESTMHHLPISVTRLINDCCQHDPSDRIASISAVIERIDLVRTILGKLAAGGECYDSVPVGMERPAVPEPEPKSPPPEPPEGEQIDLDQLFAGQ